VGEIKKLKGKKKLKLSRNFITAWENQRTGPSRLLSCKNRIAKVCRENSFIVSSFARRFVLIAVDFDPEEEAPAEESSDENASGESGNEAAATEHYVEVGWVIS
jgi:hypothetical protein